MLSVLNSYGFCTLGKADLEAALLHALMHSSCRIPYDRIDTRYSTLYIGRAVMARLFEQRAS